jgi:hypothetical protein
MKISVRRALHRTAEMIRLWNGFHEKLDNEVQKIQHIGRGPVAWEYRIGKTQIRRSLKARLFAKVVCWKASRSKSVLLRWSKGTGFTI